MPELDLLRRLGDQVSPPPLEALRDTARRRDRRTAAASAIAAAAVVAALVVSTGVLAPDDHPSPQPVEPPADRSRPLTFAEGSTIHYGDRTLEAEAPVVELDLTDDGLGFRTDDGRIWFSDGTDAEQVGDLGETGPGYGEGVWPLLVRPSWMLSANSGSRLVWFEFAAPGEPEVVVYDTADRAEVARDPVDLGAEQRAVPALLSERYVYWFRGSGDLTQATSRVRYDPSTGEAAPVSPRQVYDDLNGDAAVRSIRTNGDGGLCGEQPCPDLAYTDGMDQQMGLGLRKGVAGVRGIAPLGAGDMVVEDVSGQRFRFDDVPDYPVASGLAWLVQWLDDQTLVMVYDRADRTDLITCHLETHACELTRSLSGVVVVPEFGAVDAVG